MAQGAGREAAARRWLAERRFFAVLGAMKGGTTALRTHLHAAIWIDWLSLPWYELHYFDDDQEYSNGAEYYLSWFQWGQEWEPPWVVGDITPSYLYIPAAVPRLRGLAPHAKLVVLLRNPIDRALSHHNHDLDKGRPVGRLRKRWESELALRGSPSRSDVFGRGLYFAQLQRVLRHFPREQLLVVISERYHRDTARELQRVRSFLELPYREFHAHELPERHVRAVYAEGLSEADRHALRELYTEDVESLKGLLDDPLPEWTDFLTSADKA